MKKARHTDFVLIEKIQELAALLRSGNQSAWASHLLRAIEARGSDAHLARDILRFYEGQGSLNDIVLYVDGNPEWKINKELSALRADVLAMCQAQVAAAGPVAG